MRSYNLKSSLNVVPIVFANGNWIRSRRACHFCLSFPVGFPAAISLLFIDYGHVYHIIFSYILWYIRHNNSKNIKNQNHFAHIFVRLFSFFKITSHFTDLTFHCLRLSEPQTEYNFYWSERNRERVHFVLFSLMSQNKYYHIFKTITYKF